MGVRGLRGWLLAPYTQVFLSVVLMAASQVLLKKGADEVVSESWIDPGQLRSGWVWLGVLATIGSLVSWLYSLRSLQLSLAYNLSGLLHVIVPLSSWGILGEQIGGKRWLGIALVFAGVMITAKSAGKIQTEERL